MRVCWYYEVGRDFCSYELKTLTVMEETDIPVTWNDSSWDHFPLKRNLINKVKTVLTRIYGMKQRQCIALTKRRSWNRKRKTLCGEHLSCLLHSAFHRKWNRVSKVATQPQISVTSLCETNERTLFFPSMEKNRHISEWHRQTHVLNVTSRDANKSVFSSVKSDMKKLWHTLFSHHGSLRVKQRKSMRSG